MLRFGLEAFSVSRQVINGCFTQKLVRRTTVKISNNLPSSTLAADKHDQELPTVLFPLQHPLNMSISSDYIFISSGKLTLPFAVTLAICVVCCACHCEVQTCFCLLLVIVKKLLMINQMADSMNRYQILLRDVEGDETGMEYQNNMEYQDEILNECVHGNQGQNGNEGLQPVVTLG